MQSPIERLASRRSARQPGLEWIDGLRQDLRLAARSLRAKPSYAIALTLTLALGIGANLAIFTVVNSVLLQPLPLAEPERLVRVFDDMKGAGATDVGLSVPELEDLRARAGVFEDVAATFPASAALAGGDRVERIELLATSANYFDLLQASAAHGRVYGRAEWTPGFLSAVVISDALWRRQFGADANIIGKTIRLDEDPYTVIGVMPPNFRHPGTTLSGDVDVWGGAGFSADPFPVPPTRAARILPGAIARLKHGVSLERAQSRLNAMTYALQQEFPNDYPGELHWSLRIEPVQSTLTGNVRPTLVILLAAVSFLLLIVCVNVASLMLARSSARMRDYALRQALGASRWRVARQLLTESVLVSLIGGLAAVAALRLSLGSLLALLPADVPRLNEIQANWQVMLTALVLSLATGVLIGLAPAYYATGAESGRALKEGGRTGAAPSARQNRSRGALVVSQIALSVVLLISAGLLIRSLAAVLGQNPGLDPANLVTGQIWIPVPNNPAANKYLDPQRQSALATQLLDRLSRLPGVTYAALGTPADVPMLGGTNNSRPFSLPDEATTEQNDHAAKFGAVSAQYFAALRIPTIKGRVFTSYDDLSAPRVAIVNEAFVRKFSPSRDIVGRPLMGTRSKFRFEIIGVVADVRENGLDAMPEPRVYFSLLQRPTVALSAFLRSSNPVRSTEDALTRTVHEVDPDLPTFGVRTMPDVVSQSTARRRFSVSLMSAFALAAVLLAALGIYGVMSFLVGQRGPEFGLRQALGATRRDIMTLALRPGFVLAAKGTVIGLVVSLAVTRVLSALLFGVSAHDPVTFIVVPLVLAAVATAACLAPARRATRVDPVVALRD